jgi:valyl-tRNA synthetase
MDRFDARKHVIELLEDEGALVHVEDRVIPTPYGDRSGAVIEPWLTDQWYVDAAKLALPALQAVKNGDIKIVPETWAKTWFNWLENIQPWCVSRQLWWGHRIPAWYGPGIETVKSVLVQTAAGEAKNTIFSGHIETGSPSFVANDDDEATKQALDFYHSNGCKVSGIQIKTVDEHPSWRISDGIIYLQRDSDVLDTWFSSALWPFATLGWPDETDDLKRHYPNDVLISGFDILFIWDARMAMQGIELMGEPPWKTLYLHGLVRDAHGAKMSKSKGNTVDPLGLIDKYGADALRFTLAAMESQGRDIKLDEKRVEGYRNFATKLWNAARFLQMNGVGASDSIAAPAAELPVNRWIIGEVVETLAKLDRAFDELRFDEMADAIYHFVWGTFCDWYVELVKGAFGDETKRVAAWVFDQILVMLHPLMPFITEELWHAMGKRPYDLIVAKWPDPEAEVDPRAKAEMDWLVRLVSEVRSARTELNVPPSAKLHLFAAETSEETAVRLDRQFATIARLARLESIQLLPFSGSGAAQVVVDEATFALPLEGVIDIGSERDRLSKGAAAAEKERDSLAQRLSNPNFTERAKPEAVEKARSDHEAKAAEAERLRAALERLG